VGTLAAGVNEDASVSPLERVHITVIALDRGWMLKAAQIARNVFRPILPVRINVRP
jgi:hypothetical protein